MTAREKAAAALQMLKEAIVDLLGQPEHRGGLHPHEVRDALGLVTEENETTGIAYSVLKLMAANGELEKADGIRPRYYLPDNRGNAQ